MIVPSTVDAASKLASPASSLASPDRSRPMREAQLLRAQKRPNWSARRAGAPAVMAEPADTFGSARSVFDSVRLRFPSYFGALCLA